MTNKGIDNSESKEKAEIIPSPREAQVKLISDWAKNKGYEEGKDFGFFSIGEAEEKGENLAPHELGNLYLGFKKELTVDFRDFFEDEYQTAMEQTRAKYLAQGAPPDFLHSWEPSVKLNYSWAGRFLVVGAGGSAIDTAPLNKIQTEKNGRINGEALTHHDEFKKFFKEKTGFNLPSAKELDTALEQMTQFIPWYTQAIEKLQVIADKVNRGEFDNIPKVDPEIWKAAEYANNLRYTAVILQGARDNPGLEELPEKTSYMRDKVRHYNDLTYNNDDFADQDKVAELIGIEKLPDGGRIDRIINTVLKNRRMHDENVPDNFDRKQMEGICRAFSEKLYPQDNTEKIKTIAMRESKEYFVRRQIELTELLRTKKENGDINTLLNEARSSDYFLTLPENDLKKKIISLLGLENTDKNTQEEIGNRARNVLIKLKSLENAGLQQNTDMFIHLMSEELDPSKRLQAEQTVFEQGMSWYHTTQDGKQVLGNITKRIEWQ